MRPGLETSYGWGITGDQDGWEPRYYFTYYTTLGHRSGSKLCAETVLFIVIMVLSLMANLGIIFAVLRRKEIRTVTNCFIINLACADLVFVLNIPAIAAARAAPTWNLGTFTCKILPYSQFVCGSILLWTLTAISFDRVRCLAAAPYRSGLDHKTAAIMCAIAWVVALIIYLPVPMFFREQDVEYHTTYDEKFGNTTKMHAANATICTLVFPPSTNVNVSLAFTITIVIVSCIVPMVILVVNCYIILKKLAEIQRRLEEKAGVTESMSNKLRQSISTIAGNLLTSQRNSDTIITVQPNIPNRSSTNVGFNRLMKHRRAVRILYSNVTAVLLMWLPITIVMFLIYEDGHRNDDSFFLSNQYFVWSVVLALANTIVNPILYGFLTENFRDYYPWRKWLNKYCCMTWINTDVPSNHNMSSSRNASILNNGTDNLATQ